MQKKDSHMVHGNIREEYLQSLSKGPPHSLLQDNQNQEQHDFLTCGTIAISLASHDALGVGIN